ncbi:hypothetical protein GCM10007897_41600 [Sphingobium jiangsuense]|nr:hypothetical protein GCM10007897_41600 [Sphingobium jiangsuense]
MRALLLASLRQGEMQDGLPLRGSGYPDTQKPDSRDSIQLYGLSPHPLAESALNPAEFAALPV